VTTKSINISFLGIDERSKSAYEIFFKGIKHFKCHPVDDYGKAQLCLVDMDAYNIQQDYAELILNYPDLYVLILSLNEFSCTREQEFFIRKPVKRDQLEQLLNEIYQSIFGKTVAKRQLISPPPAELKTDIKDSVQSTKTPAEKAKPVPNSDEKVVSIKEPRKVSTANAAKLLKVENEEHFVGEQSDIDLKNPAELEKIYYDPGHLLQSIVDKAIMKSREEKQIIQLDVLNNTFYFDYEEQKVYSTVGPGIIRPLCLVHHDKNISYTTRANTYRDKLHEIIQSNKNKSIKKTLEKQSWNMESFMWLITLWCSRGRIPQGTDFNHPIYLMQWPNLTRLASIPNALRIAALLRDRRCSLSSVARHLNIEQRYVFAFFSACKAIGLANVSKRKADKLFVSEKPEKNKNQSILSKILTRLVSFSDKSSMNEIA